MRLYLSYNFLNFVILSEAKYLFRMAADTSLRSE